MSPPPSRHGCAGEGCDAGDPWPLHYVRGSQPSSFRRLCTSCVLRAHLGLFCTRCFRLLDSSDHPDSSATLKCLRCPAVAHRSCIGGDEGGGFLCPSCSAPAGFSYFPLINDSGDGSRRVVDETSARVLLAAARLAVASMSRAQGAARADADRKVKESALARKRARESLDGVFVAANTKKGTKAGSLAARGKFSERPLPQQHGAFGPSNNWSSEVRIVESSADAVGRINLRPTNSEAVPHQRKSVEAAGKGTSPPLPPPPHRAVESEAAMLAKKTQRTPKGEASATTDARGITSSDAAARGLAEGAVAAIPGQMSEQRP